MWHVYVDWICVDGINHIIYVGKGLSGRCCDPRRNKKHQSLWRKFDGKRAIIKSFETNEFACRYERILIAKYATFCGSFWASKYACNFTLGGDSGSTGYTHTQKARNAISTALANRRGLNHPLRGKPAHNRGKPTSIISRLKNSKTHLELLERDPVRRKRISDGVKKRMYEPDVQEKLRTNHWSKRHPELYVLIGQKLGKCVSQFLFGNNIAMYDSISEASRKTGIDRNHIISCVANKTKHAGWYGWQQVDDLNYQLVERFFSYPKNFESLMTKRNKIFHIDEELQRQITNLYYVDGKSFNDIVTEFQVSKNVVRAALSRMYTVLTTGHARRYQNKISSM